MEPNRRTGTTVPIAWLDRAAAILIAGLALLPARMAADFFGVALSPAPGPADLWVLFFGLAGWLAFVGSVAGLAVAIGLWKRHILGRLVGFVTAGAIGLWAIADVPSMLATDAVSLADEIRGHVVVSFLAISAAALAGVSLGISALPVVRSLRERWASR